ncbi:MAG: phosphoribosylformylglycinamidine cyclo-ligase [Eggerthellaceae bacterium]|nr:phosphoribosylformylglycinamidine cyclo-ligase [Eggerthellaceae bacterium]
MGEITYSDAGVDIQEGSAAVNSIRAAVQSTYRREVIGDIGGFGGMFSAAAFKDMSEPIMVSGTDGVGTKLQLAKLMDKHDTVGIDLVAMCVNDILAVGAEPLFFLDYIALGRLKKEHVEQVVRGISEGCKQANCSLIGGEMAEHPGVMPEDDYDLSGFTVGVVDKPLMIGPDKVLEGDVLIGLPSSGFHSNGYSLVRRVFLGEHVNDEAFVSEHKKILEEKYEELNGMSLGEALLTPTRIYVKQVLSLLKDLPDAIHALAHITGGGITENLNRALPPNLDAIVDRANISIPPVMQLCINKANLRQDEAFKTFNMGVGMVLVVAKDQQQAVVEACENMGEHAVLLGSVEPGTGVVRYVG